MDSKKKRFFFGQKQNKCSIHNTHTYLTGGHTRMCDAMRCDERKKSMGKQFGTRSRNINCLETHTENAIYMLNCAVVDGFCYFRFFFLAHEVTFSDFWRMLQLNFAINFKICASITHKCTCKSKLNNIV